MKRYEDVPLKAAHPTAPPDPETSSRSVDQATRRRADKSKALMPLLLRRAQGNRPGGNWDKDDFDVLDEKRVVGRIFLDANGAWFRGVDFHAGPPQQLRHAESREDAMVAFRAEAFRAEYERWLKEAAD